MDKIFIHIRGPWLIFLSIYSFNDDQYLHRVSEIEVYTQEPDQIFDFGEDYLYYKDNVKEWVDNFC